MNMIERYGFTQTSLPDKAEGTVARVTGVERNYFEIISGSGSGLASLKKGAYFSGREMVPTIGDFVLTDWQTDGVSRITKTLPRRTFFSRRDPSSSGHGEQAVAANFDTVFILQSLDRDYNTRRLERYLTLARQSGAVPVVILTKADQAKEWGAQLRAAEKIAGADYGVFAVSAVTGYGLDRLETYLQSGKTIVFLGSSGAGKSTLINMLAGEEHLKTGSVREADGRGRHTTTKRQLMMLKSGIMVIDTPGMRELGMWDSEEGLKRSFLEVEQYLGHCRFSDCRHLTEPGCAVKEAIRDGKLSQERWEAYRKLEEEVQLSKEGSKGYLNKKRQKQKEIALMNRQGKAADYRYEACTDSFICKVCGKTAAPYDAGSKHRNHCQHCLSSVHVDNRPGDRASLCQDIMDPIGVWVRKDGEWALIHRCRSCGVLCSNRIAADDNPALLMSIAMKPLAAPPFPLWQLAKDSE